MTHTEVTLAGVTLKNPVMTASGTFGSGMEYGEFVDLSALGAVVTKGVADRPWPGNPTPRIVETASGMMNAIGLQNPGIDVFTSRDLPFLQKYDTKIIVNVCGHSTEEYLNVVDRLAEEKVDMLEINISCPNVKEGGIAFGQNPPAIKPVALRMVYEAAHAVRIPVIGMGGIACASDAIEFLMAGASAVSVGTANFHNPYASVEIANGIREFLESHGILDIHEIIGCVE